MPDVSPDFDAAMPATRSRRAAAVRRWGAPALLLILLAAAYAATLQTHIAGSFNEALPGGYLKNEYIKDVSEIQVALNVWGTIHHTGYPLFAMLGNVFTIPLRLGGVEPALAASLYALAWGLVALGAFGTLVWRLTGRPALAALSAVLLGLARSVWIHNVVAEVYSMSLAITALLLLVALWPAPWKRRWRVEDRFLWLALLGGIGVAHHRAVAFIAPGLILAVAPHAWRAPLRWGRLIAAGTGLALLGFVPYLYLPLRAWMGGDWVYGEPGTLSGLWTEFTGREADRLVTLPADAAGWLDNARSVWDILAAELTLPGLLVALVGLVVAVTLSPRRHAARLMAVSAAGPTLFALAYHTAVLPEAILMPTVLALVFGVALAIDWLLSARGTLALGGAAAMLGLAAWAGGLIATHHAYIDELVSEPTGLHTIARLDHIPRDGRAALMLPWGPRYAAASYATLVTGEHAGLRVVDHKADYDRLLDRGYALYTEWETFYQFPYSLPWPTALVPPPEPSNWWPERLGWDGRLGTLPLRSAGPGIVQLFNGPPLLAGSTDPDGTPILVADGRGGTVSFGVTRRDDLTGLACDSEHIYLHITWQVNIVPDRNLSTFVHLLPAPDAPPIAQDDKTYPVYGLYPFTQWWGPGQLVRDDFTLPRLPAGTLVRFGLYEVDASGDFVNYGVQTLPVGGCESGAR